MTINTNSSLKLGLRSSGSSTSREPAVTLISKLSRFKMLTLRGLSLLVISAYLLLIPVRLNTDIIAAGFSLCTLLTVFIFFAVALFSRQRLKKSLKVHLSSEANNEQSDLNKNLAGEPFALVFKLSGIKIPAFFELRFTFKFKQNSIETSTHAILPSCPSETFIVESITFPHRGDWEVEAIYLELVDRFGLIRAPLPSKNLNHVIRVEPKPFHCPRWPVLASTIRIDDQISHPVERKGDLYDLKQYHPSDGARKIVWKLFAKSGQLLSRFPEPAYSPEGKVAILCLCRQTDDKLASETLAYLEELEKLDIEISFATISSNPKISKTADQAKANLIEETWSSEQVRLEEIMAILDLLIADAQGLNKERVLQNLIIAISEDSLKQSSYREMVKKCQLALNAQGIRSSIFMSSSASGPIKKSDGRQTVISRVVYRLLIDHSETKQMDSDIGVTRNFISSLNQPNSDLSWS